MPPTCKGRNASTARSARWCCTCCPAWYYRGYLMPALGRFGAWAPVVSVVLFTLYHFESPWEGPVRFLVVLPMAFVVWRLRSVRLGIVVHVALNTLSAIALAFAVVAAR